MKENKYRQALGGRGQNSAPYVHPQCPPPAITWPDSAEGLCPWDLVEDLEMPGGPGSRAGLMLPQASEREAGPLREEKKRRAQHRGRHRRRRGREAPRP